MQIGFCDASGPAELASLAVGAAIGLQSWRFRRSLAEYEASSHLAGREPREGRAQLGQTSRQIQPPNCLAPTTPALALTASLPANDCEQAQC